MTSDSSETSELLQRAADGDEQALNTLFSEHRERLKHVIRFRMNRRLQGRVDDSDVLQESYLEAAKRLEDYAQEPKLPFYLWLRHITLLKLAELHRRHLGTRMRDAGLEISLHQNRQAAIDSTSLAAQLLGHLTSPSQAAVEAEMRAQLQEALNSMDSIDREVLVLRHFEQLNNVEVAQSLELTESGASSRYLRAIAKLKRILAQIPGFFD